MPLFHALEASIDLIRILKPLVEPLRTRDPALYRQIRTAACSIALNLAEGNRRQGRDRLHHFRIASSSAAEVSAALRVAIAWGDLNTTTAEPAFERLDRILAMIWRLTHHGVNPQPPTACFPPRDTADCARP